ncbi:hypothetical protein CLF_107445 [Clonorchis sinensis]|uniref:Uncharacterized protein n=1 Tax=Clonorchis sinensis TaxID=79923 RepID=G7YQL4_CLOSI|nr:hypothetical protein CLF_107445 [Clonorchis sinensis]
MFLWLFPDTSKRNTLRWYQRRIIWQASTPGTKFRNNLVSQKMLKQGTIFGFVWSTNQPHSNTDFQTWKVADCRNRTALTEGRTKDVTVIARAQRAATKIIVGLKSVVLDLFLLEYHRLRGDLIITYALFEQGLADRFFTIDPANTRRSRSSDDCRLGKTLAALLALPNEGERYACICSMEITDCGIPKKGTKNDLVM